MDETLVALFDGYAAALSGSPTLGELRAIRERLDGYLLEANFREALRGVNDQARIARLRDATSYCMRAAEDLRARRSDTREVIRLGAIGGGVGLGAGAVATALALAVPAVALIPLIGAGFIVWRGRYASAALSIEIALLENIAGRIERLLTD